MSQQQARLSNLLNRQISGMYRKSTLSLNAGSQSVQDAPPSTVSVSDAPADAPSPADAVESSLKRKAPPSNSANSLNSTNSAVQGQINSPHAKELSGETVHPVASTSSAILAPPPPSPGSGTPTTSKRIKSSARQANGTTSSSASSGSAHRVPKKHLPPTARLADLGGLSASVEQILELVAMPLCHPEIYLHTGVRPPRGVLLYGPPGCGKTMLANAIAGEIGVAFINISAPSIVSGMSGESEKTLRETFEEAAKLAPCILFIDEIDAITPKRESAQREMERRIVAQLLTCMDDLSWDKTDNKPVIIIGATNRPDAIDSALRRAGRFDHEISMGVPDEAAREQILKVQAGKLRLSGNFDFAALAKATPGFVGADLSALTSAAGVAAVKRIFEQLGRASPSAILSDSSIPISSRIETDEMALDPPEVAHLTISKTLETTGPSRKPDDIDPPPRLPFDNLPPELQILSIAAFLRAHPSPLTEDQLTPLAITNDDFQTALTQVQPSSKREGFTTVPDVTWSSVGALDGIRDELRMAIVQPVRHPALFEAVGIANPCGVLLWGPPGCGKTLLAKAVANESRANFISVKGPELLNKYVGESERAVRQVFSRARASSPCIIFFDELDALVPRRDDNLSEASSRVVNTLLTELDGLTPRKQVFVIGATNRPDMIDPAMVRPGRLDKLLYVDLPVPSERYEILKTLARKVPLREDVDLYAISQDVRCDGFSGADIGALVREAAVAALRAALANAENYDDEQNVQSIAVSHKHFISALDKVSPSVSHQQRRRYEALRNRFAGLPVGKKAITQEAPNSAIPEDSTIAQSAATE